VDAAIYARISHVDDASTVGVDRQEADARAVVEARGWHLAAVHVDNNRSAWRRNRKRPGWDALLEDIRGHRVDVVVVAHPDRLMRQPRDLEDLLDAARDGRVQLVTAGSGRDLSDPDDVFILRIEVAHACRSSDDTSRRVARGHRAAAEAGRPGGGTGRRRAYGYTPDQLRVVPAERDVIADAATRLLSGESLGSIVRDLNTLGVPTVSGAPWSVTALRGVLVSPRAAGLREHRGQIIGAAVWPPLIDRTTWEAVRAAVERPQPPGHNRRRHLLSGIAECAACRVKLGARGGTPPGYACPLCHNRAARHLLDAHVTAEILRQLNTPAVLAALAPTAEPEDEADRAIVADCEQRVERILDRWEATGASETWARRKVEQINAEKSAALRRIAGRARRSTLANLDGITEQDWQALPLEVRRAVIVELLPRLAVKRATRRGRGLDPDRVRFE
jgi:site-specific DNA recombinase